VYGMGIAHRSAKPHRTSVSRKPPHICLRNCSNLQPFRRVLFRYGLYAGWLADDREDHLVFRPVHRHLGLGRVSRPFHTKNTDDF
jgi:hypothetical protein